MNFLVIFLGIIFVCILLSVIFCKITIAEDKIVLYKSSIYREFRDLIIQTFSSTQVTVFTLTVADPGLFRKGDTFKTLDKEGNSVYCKVVGIEGNEFTCKYLQKAPSKRTYKSYISYCN